VMARSPLNSLGVDHYWEHGIEIVEASTSFEALVEVLYVLHSVAERLLGITNPALRVGIQDRARVLGHCGDVCWCASDSFPFSGSLLR